jgi:hypothetical protein
MLDSSQQARQRAGSSGRRRLAALPIGMRIGMRDASFFALSVGAASAIARATQGLALLPPIVGT